MNMPHLQIQFDPFPNPEAIVQVPQARFTVLTSRLIRMEYSPSDQFEDRPSQAFWYRRLPAPEFKLASSENNIEIDTEYLTLHYRASEAGFRRSTLNVLVKATGRNWHMGDRPRQGQNLLGTARTLDRASGPVDLEPGLMARAGWAVVDDSQSLVFDEQSWLVPRDKPGNLDLYFFGYGHDYPACLVDFNRVAGQTPLIPRWVLGNWWSRYWEYTDRELIGLMKEFKEHEVPLAVCIIDMDWHTTQTGNRSTGWTGYTWNRELFPDPPAFLAELLRLGLRSALNLHPAEGIHPHEEKYADFATFMGMAPAEGEPVEFDCASPRFVEGYFKLLHHPIEAMGLDFWWLDWQQGTQASISGLDPLWWLNHLHFYDLGREGKKRPFIFSRWGGLGNHRYPIGFSGDTVIGWESLHNQPSFTATAANVGYGWWSHDVGGHMRGIEDDELYVRWVQYGVFSPIFRLHSTKNAYHERRPWGRGPAAEEYASEALRLRHRLIPYLYSMAWRNYTTGLPLVTPMYYSHPENEDAYSCPDQYWFGSELLAAPFTSPADPQTGLSRQTIWLPEGDWFNLFTGEYLSGGGWRNYYGDLGDIPIFARAGAILPLSAGSHWAETGNPAQLEVHIFPGGDSRFELVEDDGETTGYLRGQYALTALSSAWTDNQLRFVIAPARGDLSVLPSERSYHLCLHGIALPDQVETWVNGDSLEVGYQYGLDTEMLSLDPVRIKPTDELVLVVTADNSHPLTSQRDRTVENLRKFLLKFRLDTGIKARIERDWEGIASREIPLSSYPTLSDSHMNVLTSLLKE